MKPLLALVIPFIAAFALGIPLILLFGLSPDYLPLYGAIPSTPEAMVRVNNGCGPEHYATPPAIDLGLVGVSPSPTAVTAEWIPGGDSKSCRAILTQGGPVIASTLATAIDNDPVVAPGTYMCPVDTGTSVTLYFSYGNVHIGETVDVSLEGCPWIGDPERGSRWWLFTAHTESSFGPAIATLAPTTWRSYIEPLVHHDGGSGSKEP